MRPINARSANGLFQGPDKTVLKAFFWNAGGLTTDKFTEWRNIIIKEDVDIYGIVEAGASTDNPQYYQVPGYQTYVLKRGRQIASGILIAAKTSLTVRFNIDKEMGETDKLEAAHIDVWKNKLRRRFYVVYNPPRNKPELSWLEAKWDPQTILYGDLNAPSIKWGYSKTSATGKIIEDFADANPVEVIKNQNGSPTFISHSGSTSSPDVIMTHTALVGEIDHWLGHAPGDLGHKILKLTINGTAFKPKEPRVTRWNLKKAKWDIFTELCEAQINENTIKGSVDLVNKNICAVMLKCASQTIPRGSVKKFSPFWNDELQRLKTSRNKAREVFERTRLQEHKIRLKETSAHLRKAIITAKRRSYDTFLKNLDYRRDGLKAHRFLSKINKNREPMKRNPFVTSAGMMVTSNKDIAKIFCSYYSKISNIHPMPKIQKSTIKPSHSCLNKLENSLFCLPFVSSELDLAIESITNGKCAGPDDILPEFIKHLGKLARSFLLKFMNKVWEEGLPSEWRKADIIPIPKKDKPPNKPENCRPISLTSMLSKVYERLLISRLQRFLNTRQVISDNQAGFRQHRGAVEQVAYLSQEIKNGFHRKQSTIAVLVDLKAAFDKVWREKLLQKVKDLGIASNMYNSIRSFLAQRFVRVKYYGATSPYKQTRQGVPQGAVLSPFLFNMMIDDVVTALESLPGVRTLLYADDLVIWATSSNIPAIESCLNSAMELLKAWTIENRLEVNTSKTEFQIFSLSTKKQKVEIKFNDVTLPQTETATYLGITLDGKLGWRKHIEKLVRQGEGRLGLLKRLAGIKWGANQELLTLAYKSYIRPTMEYGSEVLLTASDNSLKSLDLIQNKALRLITGAAKSTPIAAMEIQTGLEPLHIRREFAAISLFERVKRLNIRHWEAQETSSQRLKTQKPLALKISEILRSKSIDLEKRQPLKCDEVPLNFVAEANLDLIKPINKEETPSWELKTLALETIFSRYPPQSWLHIYTDGSASSANCNAGAGVYSDNFQLSAAVGKSCTNFDGEVKAISMALTKIEEDLTNPQIVLFVDSQAAIRAICSRVLSNCGVVNESRRQVSRIMEKDIRMVFQWVPSHCGLQGNEKADELAREGAAMQQPDPPLSYGAAKRILKNHFQDEVKSLHVAQADGKRWQSLIDQAIPQSGSRRDGVACFRLKTGHDYLQQHLFRIGVVDSPICPLCQDGEMDGPHLLTCDALTDVAESNSNRIDDALMAKLYWAARSRMALMPSAEAF